MPQLKTPKSAYYTDANIEKQAQDFANKLQLFRDKHQNQKILSKKVALLVVDMQGFFYSPQYHAFIPSMAAIVPKVKELQEFCIKHGMPVFHTKHGNTLSNGGQMLKWWGSITDKNSPLANIIPEIANTKARIIEKEQNDAFWQTPLDSILRSEGIEQVIITGVMTHLCCETTARAAFVRGFEVFFAIDGTATYNSEFHFSTLYNLAHGFARPMLINEIIDEI